MPTVDQSAGAKLGEKLHVSFHLCQKVKCIKCDLNSVFYFLHRWMHAQCDFTENKSQTQLRNMLSEQWFTAGVPAVEKSAVNNNLHQLNTMSKHMKYES